VARQAHRCRAESRVVAATLGGDPGIIGQTILLNGRMARLSALCLLIFIFLQRNRAVGPDGLELPAIASASQTAFSARRRQTQT
jgi:hypothetical protein